MKKILIKIYEWIWNTFFLDFYLDPRWSIRFKIMNFISGDALRQYLCSIHFYLNSNDTTLPTDFRFRKAGYWSNNFFNEYHKEERKK